MILEIEPTSQIPIYLQLIFQIKKAIVKGELVNNEMLPSVRSMASDLGVNMHTVNKAYNLLADEAVLTKSQKGYAVQVDTSRFIIDDYKLEMKKQLENLLVDAFIHQLPVGELQDWISEITLDLGKEAK